MSTLFWLRMGLYDKMKNGVAGSISNIEKNSKVLNIANNGTDLFAIGEQINIPMKDFYIDKICLGTFALLIKHSVINKIGLLDEIFLFDDLGIKDYGLRVLEAGYRNILCKNSFVIYLDNELKKKKSLDYQKKVQDNREKLNDKWGFNLDYYLGVNAEIIRLIDEPTERELNILEIGCGCGALMECLKSIYPNAKMYGIELVPKVAKIASYMGEVLCGNVENEDIPWEKEYFDCIIMGDVLEHLMEPEKVLMKIRNYLKTGGHIIISMPNMKHYSVMVPLLCYDVFSYGDSGILDRTHVKMYTKTEIQKLITRSGFEIDVVNHINAGIPNKYENSVIKVLMSFMENPSVETFLAYQYVFKARKTNK